MKKNLKSRWNDICNEYLRMFCKRHGIDAESEIENGYIWVGGHVGCVCEISDMFLTMDEIRYDVDNEVPETKIFDWYWARVDRDELGVPFMNYQSYCEGCPDPVSPENLAKIKEAKISLDAAKEIFYNLIEDVKNERQ